MSAHGILVVSCYAVATAAATLFYWRRRGWPRSRTARAHLRDHLQKEQP